MFAAAASLSSVVVAQAPVNVVNTPGVTVENTPGVVLMNVPGVIVENDIETPVAVSVEESIENDPQSLVEYRVVGYTVTRTPGSIEADSAAGPLTGYAAMHELCEQQVGGNTRAAFTDEAILPAAPLFGQVEFAWIIPSPSLFAYTNPAEIGRISCDWYEQAGSGSDEQAAFATGLVVAPSSSRISNVVCETALPIACSAPVAITLD